MQIACAARSPSSATLPAARTGRLLGRAGRFCGAGLLGFWVLAGAGLGMAQTPPALSAKVIQMERDRKQEFETYFGVDLAEVAKGPDQIAAELSEMSRLTKQKTALLYVIPRRSHLHLVLILPGGTPIVKDLHEVTDAVLLKTAAAFHRGILSLDESGTRAAARQLHDWIILPYRKDLEAAGIDLLMFCLGDGIKGLALAALHDGDTYLVESYSLARIPAYNLIAPRHRPLHNGKILASGASTFARAQATPLPAVDVELTLIADSFSGRGGAGRADLGDSPAGTAVVTLKNQGFTQRNLERQLKAAPFSVVHVATHAQFLPGDVSQSYLQFWDSRLGLDQFRRVPWNTGQTELLVLSACQTSVGSVEAENGFAGLALKAGVPSAIGTLWLVGDVATMSLMTDFYAALAATPTKAAALREAQLAMLRGSVRIESGRLRTRSAEISLPQGIETNSGNDLSLPYYWAGFSLLSNPW